MPRCSQTGIPNGIEAVHNLQGLTDDLIKLQSRWEDYLQEQNVLDYATIQWEFYKRQAQIIPEIDHVFVDEFQDTNPVQFAIHVGWLARPETKLTVVGDDDQSH